MLIQNRLVLENVVFKSDRIAIAFLELAAVQFGIDLRTKLIRKGNFNNLNQDSKWEIEFLFDVFKCKITMLNDYIIIDCNEINTILILKYHIDKILKNLEAYANEKYRGNEVNS